MTENTAADSKEFAYSNLYGSVYVFSKPKTDSKTDLIAALTFNKSSRWYKRNWNIKQMPAEVVSRFSSALEDIGRDKTIENPDVRKRMQAIADFMASKYGFACQVSFYHKMDSYPFGGQGYESVGDISSLQAKEAQFVNYWSGFRYRNERYKDFLFKDQLYRISQGGDQIKIDGRVLQDIKGYSEKLHPFSTGEQSVTFWKDQDENFFFRVSGGCVEYMDRLYGPFQLDGKEFKIRR